MNGAGRMIDGRFELLEQLGTGGMGTVWRARDVALHRDVALKEVRPADPRMAAADPGTVRVQHERVLREARALARLRHPNVVTIHHIVDQDPYPWLVMEFVPGLSLQARLERGPLDPREVARIGRDVLAALCAAHAAGIHHRDVKPANILLREGPERATTAVLTDFGIAGLADVTPLTSTGELIGSPEYMAPERIRGADDAPASDLWSLGMTLYVSVEGTSPMRRGTSLATLAAVLDQPVPPPVHAGPLEAVLSRLLVADPESRPDAAELDALLAEVASGGGATSEGAPATTAKPDQGQDTRQADTRQDDMRQEDVHRQQASSSPSDEKPPPTRPLPAPSTTPDTPRPVSPASRVSRRIPLIAAAAVVAVALIAAVSYRGLSASTDVATSSPDKTAPTATVTATLGEPSASGSDKKSPGVKGQGGGGADASGSAGSKAKGAAPGDTEAAASGGGESPKETAADDSEAVAAESPAAISPETFANSWILKLDQTWADSGTAQRDQHLEAARAQVPDAQVLLSSNFESMGSGYWVIYVPRSFSSGTAAVEYCATELGRTTKGSCMGRYLSHDSAHAPLMCEPDGNGGIVGRCTGP